GWSFGENRKLPCPGGRGERITHTKPGLWRLGRHKPTATRSRSPVGDAFERIDAGARSAAQFARGNLDGWRETGIRSGHIVCHSLLPAVSKWKPRPKHLSPPSGRRYDISPRDPPKGAPCDGLLDRKSTRLNSSH